MSLVNIISAIGNNSSIYPLLIRDCGIENPIKIGLTYKQNLKDSKEMANDALRERTIDEYVCSAIWLGGIPVMDKICDWGIKKLGYDPKVCYTGRSPLEAASIGIELKDTDVTLRANLVTLSGEEKYQDKTMIDYSAGEISTKEAKELIEYLAENLNDEEYKLYAGISYRHCLVVDNGSIIECGTPAELLAQKGKYYRLVADKEYTQLRTIAEEIVASGNASYYSISEVMGVENTTMIPWETSVSYGPIPWETERQRGDDEDVLGLAQSFFGEKITAEINQYTVKTEEVGDRIKYFVSADREKCGWTEDKPMKLSVRIGKFATPENLWRANGEIEGFLGKNEIAPGEFGWVIPEHLVK